MSADEHRGLSLVSADEHRGLSPHTAGEIEVIVKSSIFIGGTSAVPGLSYASPVCIGTGRPSIVMLLNPTAGDSFHLKFCTGATISPFSIRNRPSRVMPVLSSVICSTGRMYQKNVTSRPRFVVLIICSSVSLPPSITILWFGDVTLGSLPF